MGEDRLEGERSLVEPSKGTISASRQREGLFHVKSTQRNPWVLVSVVLAQHHHKLGC